MNKNLLFVPLVLAACMAGSAAAQAPSKVNPDDLPKVIAASDTFFAAVGSGKIPPADLLKSWTEEKSRLDSIVATLEGKPVSLANVKFYRRLGVASLMLSAGKGSQAADGWFARAEESLDKLGDNGAVPEFQEKRATIFKERGDNLTLLGKEDQALFYLEKALRAARSSSYRDKLGEATIRERLAGIAFRREQWKEALDCVGPAVSIMTTLADRDPSFDKNALRMPLWYVAISNARLGKDALPDFNRFLLHVGRDIAAHDEADVYREAAANVGQRTPAEKGPERTAALRQANSYLLKAKQVIDASNKDEDVLEKLAIYTDLGVSYARGGLGAEAETTFKEALAFSRKSPSVGSDSPALIPVLERYAALLNGLNRPDEAAQQTAEAKRIEKLHVK